MYLARANPAAVVEYRLSCDSQLLGKSTHKGASRKAGFVGQTASSTSAAKLDLRAFDLLRMEVEGTEISSGSSACLWSRLNRLRTRLNSRNNVG